jgi:hypothetical protein
MFAATNNLTTALRIVCVTSYVLKPHEAASPHPLYTNKTSKQSLQAIVNVGQDRLTIRLIIKRDLKSWFKTYAVTFISEESDSDSLSFKPRLTLDHVL